VSSNYSDFLYLQRSANVVTYYICIGDVYRAMNVLNGEGIAVKMESLDADHPKLRHEWKVYKSLGSGPGIPRMLWFGAERGFRAMTMDLLGPSLEDLFNDCNHKFTLKTVLMLADQLVSSVLSLSCHVVCGKPATLTYFTARFLVLNMFILNIIFTVTSSPKTFSLE
jgi:serine/threonine protein kinase